MTNWKNQWLPLPAKARAFDVDPVTLAQVQEALVGWQIEVIYGATVATLPCDWNPEAVDLQLVGLRGDAAETLALCRFLLLGSQRAAARLSTRREIVSPSLPPTAAPLLVLMPRAHWDGRLGNDFAADGFHCLPLPIDASEVAALVTRAAAAQAASGARLDRLQEHGRWDDDGGRGVAEERGCSTALEGRGL